MAVVSVNETYQGVEPGQISSTSRDHTRSFIVEVDSIDDVAGNTIINANGLPQLSDPHPDDQASRVRSVTPQSMDGNPLLWLVRVRYSTQSDFAGFNTDDFTSSPDFVQNPLARGTQVSVGSTSREEVADYGYDFTVQRASPPDNPLNGLPQPILNSARQPFDPPITRTQKNMRLTITKNQGSFDILQSLEYTSDGGAVNSDSFTFGGIGFNRFVAKVDDIVGSNALESGIWYWSVTYTIDLLADGWIPDSNTLRGPGHFFDMGRAELVDDPINAGDKIYRVIRDDSLYTVSEPVPLDGFGRIVTTPNPSSNQLEPATIKTSLYRVLPFADLAFL